MRTNAFGSPPLPCGRETGRGGGGGRNKRMVGPTVWRGEWRASSNGGLEWEFGGVCKMDVHLEVLLELHLFTKPPNFGVETHMEALTGVALINMRFITS
jgi:hypothetical protein